MGFYVIPFAIFIVSAVLLIRRRDRSRCICTKLCDCEDPPPKDWDGKHGSYRVSEHCPVHNDCPEPDPNCRAEMHGPFNLP